MKKVFISKLKERGRKLKNIICNIITSINIIFLHENFFKQQHTYMQNFFTPALLINVSSKPKWYWCNKKLFLSSIESKCSSNAVQLSKQNCAINSNKRPLHNIHAWYPFICYYMRVQTNDCVNMYANARRPTQGNKLYHTIKNELYC